MFTLVSGGGEQNRKDVPAFEVRKTRPRELEGGRRIERDESAVTMATSVRGSTSRLSLNRSTRRVS